MHSDSEFEKHSHGRLSLPSFDQAHECAVNVCGKGELLLSKSRLFSNFTQHFPERQTWIQKISPYSPGNHGCAL